MERKESRKRGRYRPDLKAQILADCDCLARRLPRWRHRATPEDSRDARVVALGCSPLPESERSVRGGSTGRFRS